MGQMLGLKINPDVYGIQSVTPFSSTFSPSLFILVFPGVFFLKVLSLPKHFFCLLLLSLDASSRLMTHKSITVTVAFVLDLFE